MLNGNIAAVDYVNVIFNLIRLPFKNGFFPSYALHSHPRPAINEVKGQMYMNLASLQKMSRCTERNINLSLL